MLLADIDTDLDRDAPTERPLGTPAADQGSSMLAALFGDVVS
jgi:hypothetical protein